MKVTTITAATLALAVSFAVPSVAAADTAVTQNDRCFVSAGSYWLEAGEFEIPGDATGTTNTHMMPCGAPIRPDACFISATRTWLAAGEFVTPGDSSGTTAQFIQRCGPVPVPAPAVVVTSSDSSYVQPAPAAPTIDVGPLVEPAV